MLGNLSSGDLSTVLGVIVLFLLLVGRKQFNRDSKPLSKKGLLVVIGMALLLLVVNSIYFGNAYYQAYHPNDRYEEVAGQVKYHVYRPGYIPGERIQETPFYIWDEPYAGKTNVVRAFYGQSILPQANERIGPIDMTQVGVDIDFDLSSFVDSQSEARERTKTEIKLNQPDNLGAYTLESPTISQVYLLTNDNVLIRLTTFKESPEGLVQMAQSVR